MGDVVLFYANRRQQVHHVHRRVNEYQISSVTLSVLKDSHHLMEIRSAQVQQTLLNSCGVKDFTWHDLVYYLTVVCGVARSELIPELRDGITKLDRDFIRCCEGRRKRVWRSNA